MEVTPCSEVLPDQIRADDTPFDLDQAASGLPREDRAGEKRDDKRKEDARQGREQENGERRGAHLILEFRVGSR